MDRPGGRPPSVDALARTLAASGLPHPICVEIARGAIADGDAGAAPARAAAYRRALLQPVVNATGVLLHTNLGRAPLGRPDGGAVAGPTNVELDLDTGERGSRQRGIGALVSSLVGSESAMVVNNGAAAVLLVLAALAAGREVAVSRGESVEIGGSFRVPDVMEQSGARLVDVGTTNRTRRTDYARAVDRPGADVALLLKVHPSNYRIDGFVESASVAELADIGVPVVADLGSGLVDAACPWLPGPPPAWLAGEPAARQTLAAGAALVTFSGDKLLGGPQAGIIAGRADLVAACQRHPLARALRPGALVLGALQATVLAYLERRAVTDLPFWSMAATPIESLRRRAEALAGAVALAPGVVGAGRAVDSVGAVGASGAVGVVDTDALPGAGSAPGATIPSAGVRVHGDLLAALRLADPPIVARARDGCTVLDLRTVDPAQDEHLQTSLAAALARR